MRRRWKLLGGWFGVEFAFNFTIFGGPGLDHPFLTHIADGFRYMATLGEITVSFVAVVTILIVTGNRQAGF